MDNHDHNFVVIRVQLYGSMKYVRIEKEKIGIWEHFIQNGEYFCFHIYLT